MPEWITSDRRMELRREAGRRWQAEYASMEVDIRTVLNLLDALDAAEKREKALRDALEAIACASPYSGEAQLASATLATETSI